MRETIGEAYKAAMKARDQRRTGTLRAINAAIKDKDIANRGDGKGPLTSEEILVLLQKMVKQREESFAIYAEAGRNDLATVEKEEIDILNEFLPKGLTEAEIDDAIKAAIAKTGAASIKDMGKVIAELRASHAGQMDFGKASAAVKGMLAG